MMTEIPFDILPQCLWGNGSIQVDKVNINCDSQIFSDNGSLNIWHEFKRE